MGGVAGMGGGEVGEEESRSSGRVNVQEHDVVSIHQNRIPGHSRTL